MFGVPAAVCVIFVYLLSPFLASSKRSAICWYDRSCSTDCQLIGSECQRFSEKKSYPRQNMHTERNEWRWVGWDKINFVCSYQANKCCFYPLAKADALLGIPRGSNRGQTQPNRPATEPNLATTSLYPYAQWFESLRYVCSRTGGRWVFWPSPSAAPPTDLP